MRGNFQNNFNRPFLLAKSRKMVVSCCAIDCANRFGKPGIKFYAFSANTTQRNSWISAIRREKWKPEPFSRICSAHFVTGKWSKNLFHVDCSPSIFEFSSSSRKKVVNLTSERYERRMKHVKRILNAEPCRCGSHSKEHGELLLNKERGNETVVEGGKEMTLELDNR